MRYSESVNPVGYSTLSPKYTVQVEKGLQPNLIAVNVAPQCKGCKDAIFGKGRRHATPHALTLAPIRFYFSCNMGPDPRSFDANGKCLAFWGELGMASRLRHLCLCLCVCMMWVSMSCGRIGVERIARAGCRLQLSRENRRGVLVGGRAVCVGMAGVVQSSIHVHVCM